MIKMINYKKPRENILFSKLRNGDYFLYCNDFPAVYQKISDTQAIRFVEGNCLFRTVVIDFVEIYKGRDYPPDLSKMMVEKIDANLTIEIIRTNVSNKEEGLNKMEIQSLPSEKPFLVWINYSSIAFDKSNAILISAYDYNDAARKWAEKYDRNNSDEITENKYKPTINIVEINTSEPKLFCITGPTSPVYLVNEVSKTKENTDDNIYKNK
jgi:hypothetical protein